jgi:putative DNA primase/helicase
MPSRSLDRSLDAAVDTLVERLGGFRQRHGAMCRCPVHADRTPSLSVRIGARTLLFKCFAGCDTLDVMRALRCLRVVVPIANGELIMDHPSNAFMRDRVRAIWNEADQFPRSPVARYLRSRGIAEMSDALRYHPRTPLGPKGLVRFRPALIAALGPSRDIVAIQRLFLKQGGAGLASDLVRPKRMLARPLGSAVMLAPAGPVLGLAEGLETAMSAAALLSIPVWATLGSERLHQIAIPPIVDRLVLLPDNDLAGRLGAERATARYRALGLCVETLFPWYGLNDWNAVLRADGDAPEFPARLSERGRWHGSPRSPGFRRFGNAP